MTTAFYNPEFNLIGLGAVQSKHNQDQRVESTVAETTDLELVHRVNGGNSRQREVAFGALYTRHHNMVYNVAFKVVNNEEDAENIVQDTFIKVNKNIGRFRGDSRFTTWLHTIAHNTALNYKAHEERRPQSSGKDPTELGQRYFDSIRSANSPDVEYENREVKRRLTDAVASLNDELKQTLIMVVDSGFSYEQVAEITNVPVGTVRSRVFRARQAIDRYLMT